MIVREHFGGEITLTCDACSEIEETHCEEFSGALAKAKAHGWRVRKIGDEWLHYCPDCKPV